MIMTLQRVCGLLTAFLLHLSCYICHAQDIPVLTRVTEPVSHGEGPHWDDTENVLYYVDIAGMGLHRYDPATKKEHSHTFDKPVTMVVPLKDQKHKFVVTRGLDMEVLTWDWDTDFCTFSPIVSVDQDHPTNRWNDGKADTRGRMWAGTMGYEDATGVELNVSALYRVDNNSTVPCRADKEVFPVSISNGLAWSADDKVMYYIDTTTRRVEAFDFDLDQGTISKRRTVFEFGSTAGSPDGMTIDSEGYLWVACWGGSQVIRIDPKTGKILRQIKLPVERVSSVVFGGQNLDILYVTTIRNGLNETQLKEQPHAGAVWEITNLGVKGTLSKPAVVNCKCNN